MHVYFNILLILLVIVVFINKRYFYLYIEGSSTFKFALAPKILGTTLGVVPTKRHALHHLVPFLGSIGRIQQYDIQAQGFNRIDTILISLMYTFFSERLTIKNSEVKHV
jgi:hypothetical protein